MQGRIYSPATWLALGLLSSNPVQTCKEKTQYINLKSFFNKKWCLQCTYMYTYSKQIDLKYASRNGFFHLLWSFHKNLLQMHRNMGCQIYQFVQGNTSCCQWHTSLCNNWKVWGPLFPCICEGFLQNFTWLLNSAWLIDLTVFFVSIKTRKIDDVAWHLQSSHQFC